jgi:hypothetical protein
MERERVRDDRLDVAQRLYHALCAQYSDRFITLFDPDGACVSARTGRPDAPAVEAPIRAVPI